MTPAMLALIVSLVEEAVKVTPGIVADFKTIFNNPSPTPADWAALKARIAGTSFESLAPDAPLTKTAAPAGNAA